MMATRLGWQQRIDKDLAAVSRHVAKLETQLETHGKALAKLNEMVSYLATRAGVDAPPGRRAVERMSR